MTYEKKKKKKIQNICLYKTGKEGVSVRIISWRRILHKQFHVLRKTCDTHRLVDRYQRLTFSKNLNKRAQLPLVLINFINSISCPYFLANKS